jgi:3-oxoacyl-[acyl-carrier protein] reductase
MNFNDKIAVVTGAGQGIGKAIATRLANDGATVVINYRGHSEVANEFVSELTSKGLKASSFQADVSKDAERRGLVEHVVDTFGVIDILVNNAGVEHFGKLEDITEEDFSRVFSINVAGQLFVTQAASPHIPRGGRVVLTSSISAVRSILNHTLYAASKAAVSAMVLNLAPELGERGITINAVAPGGTETNMAKEAGKLYVRSGLEDVPFDRLMKATSALQRMAQPEEIAAAVAFLASEDASYITGSTLAVDGGSY